MATAWFKYRLYPNAAQRTSLAQTAEFTRSAFSIRDGKLFLGKVPGLVNVRWSRDLPSEPTTVTVERDTAGRYFASCLRQCA